MTSELGEVSMDVKLRSESVLTILCCYKSWKILRYSYVKSDHQTTNSRLIRVSKCRCNPGLTAHFSFLTKSATETSDNTSTHFSFLTKSAAETSYNTSTKSRFYNKRLHTSI